MGPTPDARAIRRLLVERARARKVARRDAGQRRIVRDDVHASAKGVVDVLMLDEALKRLGALDAEQARIIELSYFGALTLEQTAAALDIPPGTVVRQWTMARAWLKRAVDSAADDSTVLEL